MDGPFKHATDLNVQSLLNYEPDRFLAKFRIEAGLEPKAENYHGWEDETLAGHSLGHYLSAICMMYKTTGNEEFLRRANYIVDELAVCQEADGEGYIGAFSDGKKIFEEQVAKGNIRSRGFDLNGLWSPFYTMHKVMAGLNDAYEICGIEKALDVNLKFADWIYTVVKNLNDDQIQEMLNTKDVGRPRDVEFKPFFETHDRRYSVYFDLFNAEQWDQYQAEYKAKQEKIKKMEKMTIDFFQLGEMQPERDHNFKSEKTWVNEFKHKKYREADRGGWFSFEMDVYAGQPMELALEYWGGFPGSRTFDIFVDGTKLATENISSAQPGEFFYKYYELPDDLTVNGGKTEVKLVPHDGHRAGPLFSARTLKR